MSQYDLNDEFPDNSHKNAEKQDDRPDIPVFEGDMASVKRKKKSSFVLWLRKMFLSDRKPSEILMDVVENQLVPGMVDNFRNSVVSSIDAFVYKGNASPSNGSNNVSYSKIYKSNSSTTAMTTRKSNDIQEENKADDEFTNPCFTQRSDALKFLGLMQSYDYPTLSVHTLYMMRKMRIDYTWDAYGWTKEELANVKVVHIANTKYPWMIDLPPAHMIS